MNGRLACPLCCYTVGASPVPAPCPSCGVPLTYWLEAPEGLRVGDLQGRGAWRYAPLLPQVEPVGLGEGGTPLVRSLRLGPKVGVELWFKIEGGNPTGSFKDRGASTLVSVLHAFGARKVADDSSGNAGAALAAYAARAGLQATLFVPATASGKKLAQIRAYGAELVPVPGPRKQAAEAVRKACAFDPDLLYASHNDSPYFLAGLTTLAYELWEDLARKVPDHVVVPVGGGGLLLGMWYGFRLLWDMGWIRVRPRIHAVQAEACAPIAQAMGQGLPVPAPVEPRSTVAEGVCIPSPARGREIVQALRASRGCGAAVGDPQILAAQEALAREEGLYVEPTSAVAVAALPALLARGAIQPGDSVVVPLTGSGLKSSAG